MTRPLLSLTVPPGPTGIAELLEPLASALDGRGPAVALAPGPSPTTSPAFVSRVRQALAPDLELETDDCAVVITTSGSAGAPSGVLLSTANLTALSPWVHAGLNRPQWLLAIPATSAGGLNVVVRSMSTDDPLLVAPSVGGAEPFTAEAFARTAGRATGELLVSLVPAQIRRLLEHPAGIDALAGCARVLIGGEALPGGLAESMQALGIRATSTYGCTETAGGCVFDGEPGPQVAVQIGQDRRITISGPTVAIGYRGSDKAFHGTFTTFDIGELDRGRVRVLGRIDDIVQIKGVNVSLGAVGEILRGLDGVEEVYVVPGPPLTAFAVLSDDARFDDAQARDTVSAELGQAARPGIVLLPVLPRLPNGKVDRAALNDLVAGRR